MDEHENTTKNPLPPAIQGIFTHLRNYADPLIPATPEEEVIKINKLTGTVGSFYEKDRYLLD